MDRRIPLFANFIAIIWVYFGSKFENFESFEARKIDDPRATNHGK